jgi:hypothetical protein
MVVGAVAGVSTGYILEHTIGDGCYTWEDAGRDAAFGAAFGPLGKALGLVDDVVGAGAGVAASKGIPTATGVNVTGYTRHGINRAIGDGSKRAGVSTRSIKDTLQNPKSVKTGTDSKGRPFQEFKGNSSDVTINPSAGNIVSTNPKGRSGVRGWNDK